MRYNQNHYGDYCWECGRYGLCVCGDRGWIEGLGGRRVACEFCKGHSPSEAIILLGQRDWEETPEDLVAQGEVYEIDALPSGRADDRSLVDALEELVARAVNSLRGRPPRRLGR